jgi:hypothetical protein
MFPKAGNHFPKCVRSRCKGESYAEAIATALKSELGNSHQATKTVMRWTGANERTVKNWLAGRRGPRGEHLIALIRNSTNTLETVLRLAGRHKVAAAQRLLEARTILVEMLALIDAADEH